MNARQAFADTLAAFSGHEQDAIPVFDCLQRSTAYISRLARAIQNGDQHPDIPPLPDHYVMHHGGGLYYAWANKRIVGIFYKGCPADNFDAAKAAVRAHPPRAECGRHDPKGTMNIYQRVQQVMTKVAYVRKDKQVETYMAVTHDMVTAMVRPHFVDAGIVISPRVLTGAMVDTGRKSKSGNPAMRYEGRFEVDFVNMDEPTDRITIILDAHADDYGDKAPGKALSYATKYAILKVLMLESGENEEGRIAKEVEQGLTDEEEAALQLMRDAALEGTKSLETAWKSATKQIRLALATQLDSLKEAAKKADTPEVAHAAA